MNTQPATASSLVATITQLHDLPTDSAIWGSSLKFPDTPGTGSPYAKCDDGQWWDYSNHYAVPATDIMLPAVVVLVGSGEDS